MTHPPRPWSLRKRLTWRVLLLVVGGWIATILLSAVVLDHEMNEMFDEELLALVETSISYLDTVQGAGIPRTLGVEASNGERILRILSPDQPYAPAPTSASTPAREASTRQRLARKRSINLITLPLQ